MVFYTVSGFYMYIRISRNYQDDAIFIYNFTMFKCIFVQICSGVVIINENEKDSFIVVLF